MMAMAAQASTYQVREVLQELAGVDPDLLQQLQEALDHKHVTLSPADMQTLVCATSTALARERQFGRALARGYMLLLGEVPGAILERYQQELCQALQRGPTLAALLAPALAHVLKTNDAALVSQLQATVAILLGKGVYLLNRPLEVLVRLLTVPDASTAAAQALLKLLAVTFRQDMAYNQSKYLGQRLPDLVLAFAPEKRIWQTRLLTRLLAAHYSLADAFAAGFERGLARLHAPQLELFIKHTLDIRQTDPAAATRYLALEARAGRRALRDLQSSVGFQSVQPRLTRYLRARTGLDLHLQPLSQLGAAARAALGSSRVASDGRCIFLPDAMDDFGDAASNRQLYLALTRLEAGYHEFGTFELDLAALPDPAGTIAPYTAAVAERISELEWFWSQFPIARLAEDLFTIYEQGRVRRCMLERYPGLTRTTMPLMWQAMTPLLIRSNRGNAAALSFLYATIGLGLPQDRLPPLPFPMSTRMQTIQQQFDAAVSAASAVTASAMLLQTTYHTIADAAGPDEYTPLQTPFGRRLHPWMHWQTHRRRLQVSIVLQKQLEQQGLQVYRQELLRRLPRPDDVVSEDRLLAHLQAAVAASGCARAAADTGAAGIYIDARQLELKGLFNFSAGNNDDPTEPADTVFWYPEWNSTHKDYLEKYVRVVERPLAAGSPDFYGRVCHRHRGLVRQVRYAFELLKPQGLICLRHWPEGDELDYHALMDFVTARRAGPTAAEGLYLKRLKHNRQVAALLLVDLSRSTAAVVQNRNGNGAGATERVLDVAKQALVLFCEALTAVGDDFAIAGFSGHGRLSVDYYRVKDFATPLNSTVKGRIAALEPRRNTRLGAAIRHAAQQLTAIPARARLLMILSDGFPNDLDYKQSYALADTRRALLEAGRSLIQTHTIILSTAATTRLQALYGATRLSMIDNVQDLPARLVRIYGRLTRA